MSGIGGLCYSEPTSPVSLRPSFEDAVGFSAVKRESRKTILILIILNQVPSSHIRAGVPMGQNELGVF